MTVDDANSHQHNKNKFERAKLVTQVKKQLKLKKELSQHYKYEKLAQPATTGFIETTLPYETTLEVSQDEIKKCLSNTKTKLVEKIPIKDSAYLDTTRDGKHLLSVSKTGKCVITEFSESASEISNFSTYETVYDAKFCYNFQRLALANKNYVKLYDEKGTLTNTLSDHKYVTKLTYLPNHFLLVSASFENKLLSWYDISIGENITTHVLKKFNRTCLTHNPYNGVVVTGHDDSVVRLWTPSLNSPALSFVADRNVPICDIQAYNDHYLIISNASQKVQIFDIRNALKPLKILNLTSHGTPKISVSQNNLVSISQGAVVNVWKDLLLDSSIKEKKYLHHRYRDGSIVNSTVFQPFEDILFVSTQNYVSPLLVPGSGYAEINYFSDNPFMTNKQRRKQLTRDLLDKLPPATIMLDPTKFTAL